MDTDEHGFVAMNLGEFNRNSLLSVFIRGLSIKRKSPGVSQGLAVSRVPAYFNRSKVFFRISQSFRPFTFSMAAVLISVSFVFFVGLLAL